MVFPQEAGAIGVPEPYGEFGDLLTHLNVEAHPKQTSAVITFNYDIAADMAMYRAGIGPNYIIEAPPVGRVTVPLLKLHGSLNWATELGTPNKIRPLHLASYLKYYHVPGYGRGVATSVPIGSQLQEYFQRYESVEVESEPVIVPPSWNKADYHNALSDVWAAAADHLSTAEHIFIIGYSLPETDSFFRHLYALGSVGDRPLQRIAVFNPDISGETDNRFRRLLGPGAIARYEYFPYNFSGAINQIKQMFQPRLR